jgi:hypothetical protein
MAGNRLSDAAAAEEQTLTLPHGRVEATVKRRSSYQSGFDRAI